MECGDGRASLNRRMDLWIILTSEGFNGRVMVVLEKKFNEMKKFNVVEICRKMKKFNVVEICRKVMLKANSTGVLCNRFQIVSQEKKIRPRFALQ